MNLKSIFLGFLIALSIFLSWVYFEKQKNLPIVEPIVEEKTIPEPIQLQAPPVTPDIIKDIEPFELFLKSKNGTYSVYIKDLVLNKEYNYNIEHIFNGASLYKLPVAVGILRKIQMNKLEWTTLFEYTQEDFEGGTGSVQSKGFGTKFTVEELLLLAMKESDNAASNILQRNLTETELNEAFNLFSASKEFYLQNVVSAYQIGKYINEIFETDYLSTDSKEFLFNSLKETSFDNRISTGLDKKYVFAHKIGSEPVLNSWHDCGIISINKQNVFIVCLMSEKTVYAEFAEVATELGRLFR